MSHDIFGERFISHRKPAWHNLGRVTQEPMTARQALTEMGEPVVTLEPLTLEVDGTPVDVGQRAIVRHPTPDDDVYVPFGVVGPEYELITAGDVVTIWDEFVGQPVETTGFLRRGATFFITSKLPAIDVKGDEVEMYIGAVSPLEGGRNASCELWPVRVVCANTLRMAQDRATETYLVRHTRDARVRMGEWLLDMYQKAEANTALLKEAFEVLAGVTAVEGDVDQVLKAAYREPKVPSRNAPDDVMARRMEQYEWSLGRQKLFREGAKRLFGGEGRGQDSPAAKGTFWGLYNAVVETEDYRRGLNAYGREDQNTGESALLGDRAATKQRAFAKCIELATV